MRDFGSVWQAAASARRREPRFVFTLTLGGTGSEELHFLSHEDIEMGSVQSWLTVKPIQAVVTTLKLLADEGRTETGSFNFDVADLERSLTSEMRSQLLLLNRSPRREFARFYAGFKDIDFADFELIQTQEINAVTDKGNGVWSFKANDVTRNLKKKIFEPKRTFLTADITAEATTMNVADTSEFEMVEHGTSFTDAPSSTVGYIKIEDEIIRYTGKTATTFTGLTRHVLRTKLSAHVNDEDATEDGRREVKEVIYLELPAPKLAYALATGILLNQTGTLPAHWAASLIAAEIVLTEFQNIGEDLYSFTDDTVGIPLLLIDPGASDAKTFIEKHVCFPIGLSLRVRADGQVGIQRLAKITVGTSPTTPRITDARLLKPPMFTYRFDKVINDIELQWNRDHLADKLTRSIRVIDNKSIALWKEGSQTKVISVPTLHGSNMSGDVVIDLLEAVRDRFTGPPIETKVLLELGYGSQYEAGDIVRLRTKWAHDFTADSLTLLDRRDPNTGDVWPNSTTIAGADVFSLESGGYSGPGFIRISLGDPEGTARVGHNGVEVTTEGIASESTKNQWRNWFTFPITITAGTNTVEVWASGADGGTTFDIELHRGDTTGRQLSAYQFAKSVEITERSFEVLRSRHDWRNMSVQLDLQGGTMEPEPLEDQKSISQTLVSGFYTAKGTNLNGQAYITDLGGGAFEFNTNTTLNGHATDINNATAIFYIAGSLTLPAGTTLTITDNVQIRARDGFTINGTIDGIGGGSPGVADPNTAVAAWLPAFGANGGAPVAVTDDDASALTQGTTNYFGNTRAWGGLVDRVRLRSGSSSKYRVQLQSFLMPATEGGVLSVPSYSVFENGTGDLLDLPTNLKGTSGGPGGFRYFHESRNGGFDLNLGGTGGAGGAGLLIVAGGVALGVSALIDLSGDPGIVGVQNLADAQPSFSGSGAGGAPGAVIIVVDGVANAAPSLTGVVMSKWGDCPIPVGSVPIPDSFFFTGITRFGPAGSDDSVHARNGRSSFFTSEFCDEETGEGIRAGTAAARVVFVLSDEAAAGEVDADDQVRAQAEVISLAVTEQFSNRFDPLKTELTATITETDTSASYSHANIYVKGASPGAQYPDWFFVGSAEPALDFEIQADGETYTIQARPVLTNGIESLTGTDQSEVLSTADPIITDLDWRNELVNGPAIAAINENASFNAFRENALANGIAPAHWWGYGSAAQVSYVDAVAHEEMRFGSTVGLRAVSSVMPANPETVYEVVFLARETAANSDLNIRICEYDSDLPSGVRAISSGAIGTLGGEDDSALFVVATRSTVVRFVSLTTSYVLYRGEFTVAPTADFFSVEIDPVNNTQPVHLEWCAVRELSGSLTNAISEQPMSPGGLIRNPTFEIPMPGSPERPSAWWSISTLTLPAYLAGTDDVLEVPNNIAIVGSAVRLDVSKTYRLRVRAKGSIAMANAMDLRMEEYDSELDIAGGKYAVGGAVGLDPEIQLRTRAIQLLLNQTLTTAYQIFEAEYRPTSTAKWASPSVVDSNVAGDIHLDYFFVDDLTPVTATAEPPGLSYTTAGAGDWSPQDSGGVIDQTGDVVFWRGDDEVSRRTISSVLTTSGANEGDIALTAGAQTGDANTVTIFNNNTPTSSAQVTHTQSGVSLIIPFVAILPGGGSITK